MKYYCTEAFEKVKSSVFSIIPSDTVCGPFFDIRISFYEPSFPVKPNHSIFTYLCATQLLGANLCVCVLK